MKNLAVKSTQIINTAPSQIQIRTMKTTTPLKKCLFLLVLLLSSAGFAQQITLSIENAEIVDQGTFFTYEADVYIVTDSDFKLGKGQLYLNYNTAAFGENVFTNGNFTATQPDGSILGQTFGFPAYSPFITNDNTSSRVSFAWIQAVSSGTITADNVTATPTQLFHFSMVMADETVDPGVCFQSGGVYEDLIETACGPDSFGFPDCGAFPGTDITDDLFDCSNATPQGCFDSTTWSSGSWSNGVPDSSKTAIIDGFYETAPTGAEVSFTACSLEITPNGVLIISDGDYVQIENDIHVQASGTVYGALVVRPEGSLVQVNDDAEVINDAEIYVYRDYDGLNNRDFVIAGSPFDIITREDDEFIDMIQFRNHSTANFTPNAAVAAFDPLATNFADDDGNNWQAHTGVITPGEGYLVMPQTSPTVADNQNYTFIYYGFAATNGATLNNGVINFDVVFGDDQNDSPNMLANPYASAIDADLLTAANSALFDTYYFWEHLSSPSDAYPGYNGSNYDMGDISMYTPGSGGVAAANGGDIPDQYIAAGEGFGVKAKAAGTAFFNNSMRVTGNNAGFKSTPLGKDRIWLSVQNEAYRLGSQTLVAFVDGASESYDSFYDAARLATPVSFYSVLYTGEELAIQGRQAFDIDDTVALGFRSQIEENSAFTVSIVQMETFLIDDSIVVLLEDNYKGTITNLSEGDYTFTSGAGTFNDRFQLIFQERVLNVNSPQEIEFSLYPNPTDGMFSLQTGNAQVEKVEIVDLNGRIVMSFQAQESYNISYMEAAVYFVRVYTDQGVQMKRLIKR